MINSLYIDPTIVTYTVQIITGVIIAIGAGVGIWIKKFKKKMNIKEKKKKEETDDIIVK